MIVRACRSSDFQGALALINAAAVADRTRRISESAFLGAFGTSANVEYNAIVITMTARGSPDKGTPHGETLAGFAWWDLPKSSAVKFEGWVHPDWRRKGVGTALLTALEVEMRPDAPITLTGRTYNDIPGAETLFRLRGYEETRHFYMMSTLLSAPIPDVPVPPGITLRTYRPTDLSALVDADNAIFAGHWESVPRFPPAWKRDLIDTRPHDPSLWILAWDGDRVVGECLSHLSREAGPEDAWTAIVGVREDWRGRGLGRAVLARGLLALQQGGFKTASLHVDGENTPAISLYRALGMEIARTRLHFAKKVRG